MADVNAASVLIAFPDTSDDDADAFDGFASVACTVARCSAAARIS